MRKTTIHCAAEEFSHVSLGDGRLNKRLGSIVVRAVASPSASFPRMVTSDAEREALYRFVENDRVEWTAILEPHQEATSQRCRDAGLVRVAHDTTFFSFEGEREGLGPIGGNQRGFAGHFSLALSSDDQRAPLGLLALSTFVRSDQQIAPTKAARQVLRRRMPRADRESARWMEGVHAAEERVGQNGGVMCIHVMDREADDFALLADLVQEGLRFVVRGSVTRRLDRVGRRHVDEVLDEVTARAFRTVPLTARTKPTRGHTARKERPAKLMIRGTAIVLGRPEHAKHATKRLQLNVVHVFEKDPPDGTEAIEWALYTTEPIDTRDALTAVVDHYRARWRAEEYFKALKTGCAFEKRQLTTYQSLLRALALLIPIAWHLLAIRTLARDDVAHPASDVVDDVQLDVLRYLRRITRFQRIQRFAT